ncbi:MAG: cache domain-containing protein [Pseudomonadota bacterium]
MKLLHSVRLRLLLLALLPLVVLLPLLLGFTMQRWIERYDDLLIAKVASDLRIAEEYFRRIEETQAAEVSAIAQSTQFEDALRENRLDAFLEDSRGRSGLDFLVFLPAGQIAEVAEPVVALARPDAPSAGLALFSAAELAAISADLAAQAAVPLVPTPAAREISRDEETRGMVLLAAHRAVDGSGVLLGGRLLNRDLAIIDRINALIYSGEEGETERTGTTTLFLDDVRISTNVRLFEGARALGTRVSEAVWSKVMDGGETWLDRAFVVNDWYISGYVPLADVTGKRIGMLYTGFLEAPFVAQRSATILWLILAFLAVVGLSVPLFLRMARGIFTPLEQMTATMARVEAGALDARIGTVASRDEIGAVAQHLDRLLDQVQERDAALNNYAGRLNELVEERTEELRDANTKLEATFAQLVMSEKLASVGEITAGVAHEINNPVAVIQGNLEVLRSELGEVAEAHRTELDLIDAQTHRINVIVSKLLNFARPQEVSGSETRLDARKVAEDVLVLVAADLRKSGIVTEIQGDDAPPIQMSETELQQVLINLVLNAAQAMGKGGKVTIAVRKRASSGVEGTEIAVSDTGPGIPAEQRDHVFDPFFTTKLGEGTGLGLSISQALITRAGGLITIDSTPGEGATFFVWCPAADISSDLLADVQE